jgi:hypothetical protein
MDKLPKFMSGFWLADECAARFLACVKRREISIVAGYREALKMWCEAQDRQAGAQGVNKPAPASPVAPVKQAVNKPAPALPVPMWRVHGFVHGMAHREAIANGWRPGMAIPAGLAASPPATPAREETGGTAKGSQETPAYQETGGTAKSSQETSQPGDFC